MITYTIFLSIGMFFQKQFIDFTLVLKIFGIISRDELSYEMGSVIKPFLP
jgi:hypothetical protein